MKKSSSKIKIIIIAATAVVLLAGIIVALLFAFKDNYKPDKETLSIVNEASLTVYNTEITDKYDRKGTETIDDETVYVFEFKLENGDKATFAFAKNLKETRKIYYQDEGGFNLVIFVSDSGENRDNDVSWPKGWK